MPFSPLPSLRFSLHRHTLSTFRRVDLAASFHPSVPPFLTSPYLILPCLTTPAASTSTVHATTATHAATATTSPTADAGAAIAATAFHAQQFTWPSHDAAVRDIHLS